MHYHHRCISCSSI